MKWVSCIVASFLPLSAALSSSAALFLEEATAAFNIPKVPKVENSDADGFPVLPTVGSLLTDVSQAMKALSLKTRNLEEELHKMDQKSEAKLNKQEAAYNQLLRKQEVANQKQQAKNAERAKAIMGLRDKARKTQAEIKKEEYRNDNQRAKLRSLQDELKQVQQATEDALSDSDSAKAPSRAQPDASIADEDVHVPQRGLSFLQVKPKTPSDPAGELLKEPAVSPSAKTPSDPAGKLLKASRPAVTPSTDEDDDYGSVDDDEASAKKADAKVVAGAQKTALRSQAGHSAAQSKESKSTPSLDHIHQAAVTATKAAKAATAAMSAKAATAAVSAKAAKPAESAKAAIKAAKPASMPVQEHRPDHAETNAKTLQKPQKHSDIIAAPEADPLATVAAATHHANAEDAGKPALAEEASEHTAVDEQSEQLAPAEQSQEALTIVSDSTGVLHEGVAMNGQMAAGVVASLSSGLKTVQEQVRQSEANLKRHFQKAYRAGKKRHDALIKQREALEISMRSMQAQEQKFEATLKKLRATDKTLQQKISSIAGFLGKAIAPIGNAKQTA